MLPMAYTLVSLLTIDAAMSAVWLNNTRHTPLPSRLALVSRMIHDRIAACSSDWRRRYVAPLRTALFNQAALWRSRKQVGEIISSYSPIWSDTIATPTKLVPHCASITILYQGAAA